MHCDDLAVSLAQFRERAVDALLDRGGRSEQLLRECAMGREVARVELEVAAKVDVADVGSLANHCLGRNVVDARAWRQAWLRFVKCLQRADWRGVFETVNMCAHPVGNLDNRVVRLRGETDEEVLVKLIGKPPIGTERTHRHHGALHIEGIAPGRMPRRAVRAAIEAALRHEFLERRQQCAAFVQLGEVEFSQHSVDVGQRLRCALQGTELRTLDVHHEQIEVICRESKARQHAVDGLARHLDLLVFANRWVIVLVARKGQDRTALLRVGDAQANRSIAVADRGVHDVHMAVSSRSRAQAWNHGWIRIDHDDLREAEAEIGIDLVALMRSEMDHAARSDLMARH